MGPLYFVLRTTHWNHTVYSQLNTAAESELVSHNVSRDVPWATTSFEGLNVFRELFVRKWRWR